jgi:hypothetical protein
MNTPEFNSLVNHYTACPHCKPQHNVYCVDGRNLWIDEQAAFVASLATLTERQYWLSVIAKDVPKFVEKIKAQVLEKYRAKK